jgi:formylglycine-generating enzyme required for sulfatase activity
MNGSGWRDRKNFNWALLWTLGPGWLAGCALIDPVQEARPSIEYVAIPAGSFSMGSPIHEEGREESEGPEHRVSISAFQLGKYEVTRAQFARFLKANAAADIPESVQGDPSEGDLPAVGVSWDQASEFARWMGGRLPSEAEWEYAARAGTSGARYEEVDAIAWHNANSGGVAHEVGGKLENDFGLFDMLGNVYEWTQDRFDVYTEAARSDPTGASDGNRRVARGGAFTDPVQFSRAAYRSVDLPGHRYPDYGFRVARDR